MAKSKLTIIRGEHSRTGKYKNFEFVFRKTYDDHYRASVSFRGVFLESLQTKDGNFILGDIEAAYRHAEEWIEREL